MALVQIQRRCGRCNKVTTHDTTRTNHWLHLAISVLCIGLWIPVWILVSLSNAGKGTRCIECM